ncbi:MAG: hypothetical protein E7130_04275 [Rikenellaceae bacterium]|nr:hypothetical protein [Rikenellaceae bacterium]MBQ3260863.1 hypothetical protein [Alistipes sp.]MBQ7341640.1 hypothetical protein [Alistipes sp.]
MRIFSKIVTIFAVATLAACQELPNYFVDDNTIARVGRKELRMSDLEQVVPQSLSGADSVSFVGAYIDRWIVKQLKLEESELIFSASASDIERKVEEYKQSLLIRKIEQYYIDNEPRTIITDDDIEEYYKAHKSEFRLDKTIVKGRVVAFGEKYRQRDKLFEMMRSPKAERQKDFRDICIKNGFSLKEFTEWTEWSDFLAALPTLRSRNYDSLLDKKGSVQKMNADGQIYYFEITEVLNKGDIRPFELAREDISRVLSTLRRSEAIKSREEIIRAQALENGHARIYKDTEQ